VYNQDKNQDQGITNIVSQFLSITPQNSQQLTYLTKQSAKVNGSPEGWFTFLIVVGLQFHEQHGGRLLMFIFADITANLMC